MSSRYAAVRWPRLKLSFIFEKKSAWMIMFLLLVLALLSIFSVGIGTLYISPLRTIQVMLGTDAGSMEANIIWNFRMPRLVMAGLAGMALALSGTILQAVVRNPLASPDVIGVTSGAAMMAVLYLAVFNVKTSIVWMPLFAFAGAAAVSAFIYFGAWKKGVSPMRMILVGLGVTALLEALKTIFLIFSPIFVTSQAKIWITGTVYGANWTSVKFFTPWLLLFVPLLFVFAGRMNIQVLGNELPVVLGGRIQLQRFALLVTAAALAGSAVAFVGGIGFVGLMAPHLSRRLVGGSHGLLLICSAIVGGLLLMTADLIGRTIFAPRDVPAGVFTAVIGAPFFLYLLVKTKKKTE
ncbi:FecCD family ABC transporter permease [Paenibacillus rigui]|uniref:Iron ABC transporter permease n=1 Tax=Paenibacillus rigui TaxID=554312 RepID=A0A229UFZ1_9BACL|nr:iron ABC transporter permease [Paenibacillus rigui]OXM82300.1 iron ABC transporter permease [Paenibacillus rigui]